MIIIVSNISHPIHFSSCGHRTQEYGLQDVCYTGFLRVTGYNSLISASDMSYAVTALLDCVTPAVKANNKNSNNNNDNRHGGSDGDGQGRAVTPDRFDNDVDEGGEKQSSPRRDQQEDELLRAFNIAFDALNPNSGGSGINGVSSLRGNINMEGYDLNTLVNGGDLTSGTTGLGAGIRLAMSLQRCIVSTAMSLMDKKSIIRLNHFRYAYIHCTSGSGGGEGRSSTSEFSSTAGPTSSSSKESQHFHHVFARPLALCKLAIFLMDIHRENNKWTGSKSRPLLLMAEKPRSGTYLVVGYQYAELHGDTVRSRFGKNFELAAKTIQGGIGTGDGGEGNSYFRFDSFDSNFVEVDASKVQRFMEQLHYIMDAR